MSSRYSFSRLAGVTLAMMIASQVQAEDCEIPVILGEKPAMDAYADYSDFLVAIMDYKARERARNYQLEQCPEVVAEAERQPPPDDPTITLGPETLDAAVARSARLPRFDYAVQRTWYNRTTSRSFGLPDLQPSKLEGESIRTRIDLLEEGAPPLRLQRLALNLQGPLPADDGSVASKLIERQFTDVLKEKDQALAQAYQNGPSTITSTYTVVADNGSYVRLSFRGQELIRVYGFAVTCMSRCP